MEGLNDENRKPSEDLREGGPSNGKHQRNKMQIHDFKEQMGEQ